MVVVGVRYHAVLDFFFNYYYTRAVNACDEWRNLLIWNAVMYASCVATVMEIG